MFFSIKGNMLTVVYEKENGNDLYFYDPGIIKIKLLVYFLLTSNCVC